MLASFAITFCSHQECYLAMSLSHFSLSELEQKQDFVRRHIGPSEAEMAEMLASIGAESLDDLMQQTVPEAYVYRNH